MYDYHYGTVKATYGDRATLLFTDTDSLCYAVETDDIYNDMRNDSAAFDTSNYPPSHPNFSIANKKVIGKMKDELGGAPMLEFVGLRAKLYAYRRMVWKTRRDADGSEEFVELAGGEEEEVKKCKGVGRAAVKHDLLFEHYKRCLLHREKKSVEVMAIQSNLHQINTVCQRKIALAYYDDKRWQLDDIASRPYGHYKNV